MLAKKNYSLPRHQGRADRQRANFVNLRQAGDPVELGPRL